MGIVQRILHSPRLREAKARLAESQTPLHFAQLAHEYACRGDTAEALRVCEEGLAVFPGSAELARLADRSRRVQQEDRMAELKRELASKPRPAQWREMCALLLETGQVGRAEEIAQAWLANGRDGEALLALAQARAARFLCDRGREAGRRAFEALGEAEAALPGDRRPLALRDELATRIGALAEVRRTVARLLELAPGDAELEARFRALEAEPLGPTLEQALREVEKSGALAAETTVEPQARQRDVRPVLKQLAQAQDVEAAVYVRGATALVQGPRGASAERVARSVRGVVQTARTAARRLGLGQVAWIELEGSAGSLGVAVGSLDAGALWTRGRLGAARAQQLLDLAGQDAVIGGDAA